MGRSGDTDGDNTEMEMDEIWGTWEELLLACAVTRHGTSSWDSVAMEVQSRSSSSAHLLTPNTCRLRYLHLHRRFSPTAVAGEEAAVEEEEEDLGGIDAGEWVEELRKIRVAELRREVERCDLSIVSLEKKVNRLKEEREEHGSGGGVKESNQDLIREDEKTDPTIKDDNHHHDGGDDGVRSPGSVAAEISGRSWKESNESNNTSMDQKSEQPEKKPKPSGTETVSGTDRGQEGEPGGESGESVAESKESSDVQSSASLSTRRRKNTAAAAAAVVASRSSGGEAEGSAISETESQPLMAFLDILCADKSGAVFERRLESQQSETYQSTIKRHMDFEMIRAKLEIRGSSESYTSATEFYRDLLLLCTNALVFFPKSAEEHAAALHLHSLITKQINSGDPPKPHRSSSSSHKEVQLKDLPKLKTESDVGGPLLEKPAAIIVCRKRSSLAKASPAAVGNSANSVVEEEKQEKEKEKDPVLNPDPNLKKTTSTRGPRTSKTRSNTMLLASSSKSQKQSSEKGSEKSVATPENIPKKRNNASDFLKRLKDNTASTSSKGSHGDTSKKGKPDSRRDRDHGSSRKQTTPPDKKNVGRPPKRPGSSMTPPPSKRLKEVAAKPPPPSKRRRNR